MGLFSNNKKLCPICGEPTPRLFPTKVEDVPICKECDAKICLPQGALEQMDLNAFGEYLSWYEQNASLRSAFHREYRFDVDGWNDEFQMDFTNRLFRLSDKDTAIVFAAANLKSFRIMEDHTPLYEGDLSALKCYESNVPQRARELQPLLSQYQLEKREYDRLKRQQEMMQTDENQPKPYISEPRLDLQKPIQEFRIQLVMEHPYWPVYEGTLDAPDFSMFNPSIVEYMNAYQKKADELRVLAESLMKLIAPSAPVLRNTSNAFAAKTPFNI